MVKVDFNERNNVLTLTSTKPIKNGDDYINLFNELGDLDVIQANEIKQNYIAFSGLVYELSDNDIERLSNDSVSLDCLGKVSELGDEDFNKWYGK